MKRPARTFVVERRHGRKARPWFNEQPALAIDSGSSAAVREANDLFRALEGEQSTSRTPGQDSAVRVLEDLRDPEPAILEVALHRTAARSPVPATDMPRRPRGRPRKLPLADGEMAPQTKTAGGTQGQIVSQEVLPGLDDAPVTFERPKVVGSGGVARFTETTAVAEPNNNAALASDQIVEAVVAQVKQRSSRAGRIRSVNDLPVGQRWKRRLHPASW